GRCRRTKEVRRDAKRQEGIRSSVIQREAAAAGDGDRCVTEAVWVHDADGTYLERAACRSRREQARVRDGPACGGPRDVRVWRSLDRRGELLLASRLKVHRWRGDRHSDRRAAIGEQVIARVLIAGKQLRVCVIAENLQIG